MNSSNPLFSSSNDINHQTSEHTKQISKNNNSSQGNFKPLAEKLRPKTIDDLVGQPHLFSKNKPLRFCIENQKLHSMILWGPSGCGKTTFAHLLQYQNSYHFISLSAISATVKTVKAAVEQAKHITQTKQQQTIIFLDEVHRFNKAQQDSFLPYIENGTIIFIGATTENPSFSLNNALLSRARVYLFQPLDQSALFQLMNRVEKMLSTPFDNSLKEKLFQLSNGDARQLINIIQTITETTDKTPKALHDALSHQQSLSQFDNKGDYFYDLVSAMHKTIRGSNPHAALYWLCRIIDGGGDIAYVFRRLAVLASEDIGNADPRALEVAINGWQAFERIGAPEGYINLSQVVTYLACAPKSNASYLAFKAAMKAVKNQPSYPVPNHLTNAPTQLMKSVGKSDHYRYAHDEPFAYAAGESYFPQEMEEASGLPITYYHPNDRGLEIKIKEKLSKLAKLDKKSKKDNNLN